ncbi:hypothetical protein [Cellvibrio sp. NN19]|uniref:hypothetical protein n=1 Tax=Cellvibrio chitinivorans TaxID=3102792 RepID=UPI002B40B1EF|nr:hypothetical protein [Cellvibrio sp. NN19]
MRRPALIISIMLVSFLLSDIQSTSAITGVLFPLLFAAATLTFILWLLRRAHQKNIASNGTDDRGSTYLINDKHSNRDVTDSTDGGSD